MDRMPKEYKIPVYIISMTVAYFCIYLFVFYRKFSLSPASSIGLSINVYAAFVIVLTTFFLALYLRKKEAGRIGLIVIYLLQILFSLCFLLALAFLKNSSVIIANLLRITTFDVYVLVAMLGNSSTGAVTSILIFDAWFLILIYQLSSKQVREFIKAQTYPLVNTQVATVVFVIAYASSLAAVSAIIKL
ncbi:MAG: hypothetical protein ACPLZB_04520 [Caldisericaceae bacterium]